MGQWSHRRRRGGGQAAFSATARHMTAAQRIDSTTIDVIFSAFTLDTEFSLADFNVNPSGATPTTKSQAGATVVRLGFPFPITTQVSLTYDGDTPNMITPQTINITLP